MRNAPLILAALAASSVISCSGSAGPSPRVASGAGDEEVAKGLDALFSQRVFLGHQSVGKNIIDGLVELNALEGRPPFAAMETRSPQDISGPGLYHAAMGRNRDPLSKLRDFDDLLRGGLGDNLDAACLKFCYVDIDSATDVESLYEAYRDTMAGLGARFPRLAFVHCTVPLTTEEGGVRGIVRRFLRKGIYADNEKRESFNRLMRSGYGDNSPFFDLALAESTGEMGSAPPASGVSRHLSLRPEYSLDGGHLNAIGSRRAASFLAASIGRAFSH